MRRQAKRTILNSVIGLFAVVFVIIGIAVYYNVTKPVQLSTPINARVEGTTIVWDAVDNAASYTIKIDDNEYAVEDTTSYFLIDLQEIGIYKINIKANSDSDKFYSSNYSDPVTYILGALLPAPTMVKAGNVISWDPIANATGYMLIVNEEEYELLDDTSFSLENITEPGHYRITLRAVSDNDMFLSSNFAEEIQYTVTDQLVTPANVQINDELLTWDAVDNATQYIIDISGDEYVVIAATQFDLSSITKGGTHNITIKAQSNFDYYLDSDLSESIEYKITKYLAVPTNISISGTKITWNIVTNAVTYNLKINSTVYPVSTNSYTLSSDVGDYSVSVQAVGDGIDYISSNYSDVKNWLLTRSLPYPSNIIYYQSSGYLYWDTVTYATSYTVTVAGTKYANVTNRYLNLSHLKTLGSYSIQIQAHTTRAYYYDSSIYNTSFMITMTLDAPTIIAEAVTYNHWDEFEYYCETIGLYVDDMWQYQDAYNNLKYDIYFEVYSCDKQYGYEYPIGYWYPTGHSYTWEILTDFWELNQHDSSVLPFAIGETYEIYVRACSTYSYILTSGESNKIEYYHNKDFMQGPENMEIRNNLYPTLTWWSTGDANPNLQNVQYLIYINGYEYDIVDGDSFELVLLLDLLRDDYYYTGPFWWNADKFHIQSVDDEIIIAIRAIDASNSKNGSALKTISGMYMNWTLKNIFEWSRLHYMNYDPRFDEYTLPATRLNYYDDNSKRLELGLDFHIYASLEQFIDKIVVLTIEKEIYEEYYLNADDWERENFFNNIWMYTDDPYYEEYEWQYAHNIQIDYNRLQPGKEYVSFLRINPRHDRGIIFDVSYPIVIYEFVLDDMGCLYFEEDYDPYMNAYYPTAIINGTIFKTLWLDEELWSIPSYGYSKIYVMYSGQGDEFLLPDMADDLYNFRWEIEYRLNEIQHHWSDPQRYIWQYRPGEYIYPNMYEPKLLTFNATQMSQFYHYDYMYSMVVVHYAHGGSVVGYDVIYTFKIANFEGHIIEIVI